MFELGEAVGVGHGGGGGGQTDRGKYNEMSDGSNIELGFSGEGKGAGKQEGRNNCEEGEKIGEQQHQSSLKCALLFIFVDISPSLISISRWST